MKHTHNSVGLKSLQNKGSFLNTGYRGLGADPSVHQNSFMFKDKILVYHMRTVRVLHFFGVTEIGGLKNANTKSKSIFPK